mgnify:CR=1 FL=1|jgi:hypothetical protein
MSFFDMEMRLLGEFENNKNVWVEYVENRKKNGHSKKYVIDSTNDFYITYPGYKTYMKKNGTFVYDYRVNYKGYAISHPSIIIDLYNKVIQYPEKAKRMKEFLITLSKKGDLINLEEFEDLRSTKFAPVSKAVLNETNAIFERLDKSYLKSGNIDWNFSLEDLANLISWISLQEDINYPMSIGHYQGRMMPFYRYLEAIYSAIAKRPKDHNIEKVIERALIHKQPSLWPSINYDEISQLKSLYK